MTRNKKFRILNDEVKKISLLYVMSKKQRRNDNSEIYERFVNKVSNAFYKLGTIEKDFINNEFFLQSSPYWWVKIYSKTTYYRYKRNAMTNFMRNYNNE